MLETLFNLGASVLTGGATGLLGTALSASSTSSSPASSTARSWTCVASTSSSRRPRPRAPRPTPPSRPRPRASGPSGKRSKPRTARPAGAGPAPGEGRLMQFVDAVRGLTRPLLTWSLFALVGAIYFLLGASDLAAMGPPAPHRRDRALSLHRRDALVVRFPPDREAASAPGRSGPMSDLEAWVARGVVGAVVGACVGLFVRVRRLESAGAVASKSLGDS